MSSNTVTLYRGPSRLNGESIIVTATKHSDNDKTGDMVQIMIAPDPHIFGSAHHTTKTGDDESVCGDCDARPSKGGHCYVLTFQGPLAITKAILNGTIDDESAHYLEWTINNLRGRTTRLGSWGDPAAMPVPLIERLTEYSHNWTGYTHQWRQFPELKKYLMASVDSKAEKAEAAALGWRTFRVTADHTDIDEDETLCPATKEGGLRTKCDTCCLCNGAIEQDKRHRRNNIVAKVHGKNASKFMEV